MAKPLKKLTDDMIAKIKPKAERQEIADRATSGLYLVVQPSGAKSWAVRYRLDGAPKKTTLGKYGLANVGDFLTIESAREKAAAMIERIERGLSAVDEGVKDKLGPHSKFDDVLAAFKKYHFGTLRKGTIEAFDSRLNCHIVPAFTGKRIGDIDRQAVLFLIDGLRQGIVDDNGKVVARPMAATAIRVQAILRQFFGWCEERSIVKMIPVPRKKKGHKAPRERVLSRAEIRLLWKATEEMGYPWGPVYQTLLLSAQRKEEVCGLVYSELELNSNAPFWELPGARTKNKRAHMVPLSSTLFAVLKSIKVINSEAGFVFTKSGKLKISGMGYAHKNLIKIMQGLANEEAAERGQNAPVKLAHFTIHDVRRTCASGLGTLKIAPHIIEAILNHKTGVISGVAAVYNHYDYFEEKREALEKWADEIAELVAADHRNVIAFARRA